MRTLLVLMLLSGTALLVAGTVDPGMFVLSLLGLAVLTGTAAVALAAMGPPRPPHAYR